MAYSTNAGYASPMGLTGTDFSVTMATGTHLAITFRVDPKMMMKRALPMVLVLPIVFVVCLTPVFIMQFSTTNRPYYDPFSMVFPILMIVFVVCMMGLLFGAIAAQAKKLKELQLVLDKDTNKMNLYVPNTYIRNRYRLAYSQYFTSAWDLDKIQFRLIAPGEMIGPGMGMLRGMFKNMWLVMYSYASWIRPNMLFASVNAELVESLMRTIDNFLRGNTGFSNDLGGGLLSERPYFP